MKFVYLVLIDVINALITIGNGVLFIFSPVVWIKNVLTSKSTYTSLYKFLHTPIRLLKARLFTLRAKRSQTLLVKQKKTKPTASHRFSFPSFKLSLPSLPHLPNLPKFSNSNFAKLFSRPKKRRRIKPVIHLTPKQRTDIFFVSFFVKFKYFLAGGMFSFIFIFLPLLFLIFIQDLPNPRILTSGQIPQTTKIYDRNGVLLYQIYGGQNRTIVPLADIPTSLQQATIATEDKDFYTHPGFDVMAISRSVLKNSKSSQVQGGSTITQQLIKSALLTPETSLSRKVKEAVLAFWAERMYSKRQILEMYFNQIPYGGTAWGAEAASQTYFGKHVKDLDLAESAFLAGVPQAPTIYSPFGSNPNAWKARQKEVLFRMVSVGYISRQQAQDSLSEDLHFEKPQTPIHAPHFVMYVKDQLVKKYGLPMVEKGGLTVVTSLDTKLQDDVQKIVSDEVNGDAYLNLTNGAAVVTNPKNGDILAMVGSRDFNYPGYGNYNVATALRQPGSSIKIVTYTTALSQGFTAATILDDSPAAFASYPGGPVYSPVNYDGKSHGRIPLRIAFGNSFNITAVRTLNQVGIPAMVDMGKRMGISSWGDPSQYGLSITLGAAEATMLDMSTVFGTVANSGERVDLNPFLKITDGNGYVLEEKKDIHGTQVISDGVAYIVSNILADNSARVLEFGSNSPLYIPGRTVSVKTGTSDWKKDNWTIGFSQDRLATVWVGNADNSPMSQALASGITGAAPIWNKVIQRALEGKADQPLIVPASVVSKSCFGHTEFFVKGTEGSVNCAFIPQPAKKQPTPKTN